MNDAAAANQAPDQVINPKDPGDETRRRYRYQDVRAASYILALFDEAEGVVEIVCEQQEDILVKYAHGKFRGVQIKTKEDGSVPLKAGDKEVVKSLQRFIAAEKEFPGQFDKFVLGCNCGFWEERQNTSNIQYLLEEAKGKSLTDASKKVKDFLKRLCPPPKPVKVPKSKKVDPATDAATLPDPTLGKMESPETYDQILERALNVLQKVVAEAMPPLKGMMEQLVAGLSRIEFVGKQHTYDDLASIAEALIGEVSKASSKEHASFKQHYFELCRDPDKARQDSIIDWKRFTRQRAENVICKAFRAKTPVSDSTPFSADNLPSGTRTQQAKMTAGGIVIGDIEESVQQRQAAEYVLSTWIAKHGVHKANMQYQDLRSAVLTESNEARKQVQQAGGQYGHAMLRLVKERIRSLYDKDGSKLHGVRYDQLLGIAGILTEECRLWWSEKFDLSEEVQI